MVERFANDDLVWRAPEVLWRRLLDGLLVLGPEMLEPMRVTTPGEVLWVMLEEPCSVADLLGVWAEIFSISDRTARAEVEPILRTWCEGGAIVVSSDSP